MNEEQRDSRWTTPSRLWDELKPIARRMRREPTQAENALWQALRRHQVNGTKFRRQHAIGQFIVDFYCSSANLLIEVDGTVHENTREEDRARQEFLERLELRVIRFSNDQVLGHLEFVLGEINRALRSLTRSI